MKRNTKDQTQKKGVGYTEGPLLAFFIVISALAHAIILFSDFYSITMKMPSTPSEWVIEADLFEFDESKQTSQKVDSFEDTSRMLPQVPKKFSLDTKDETVKEDIVDISKKKKEKQRLAEKKKNQDHKKVSLERLLREVNRLQNKDKKREKAKKIKKEKQKKLLSKKLKYLKKSTNNKFQHSSLNISGAASGYIQNLKSWLMKFYSLPDIEALRSKKRKAEILLVINRKGVIKRVELRKSSKNSAFDKLALKTVKDASPFPAPPKEWIGKPIVLNFSNFLKDL